MPQMRAENSAHLADSARRRRAATLARAMTAIEAAELAGIPTTVSALARQASVSRSWLYAERSLLDRIQPLLGASRPVPRQQIPPDQRASAASLQTRLDLTNRRVKALTAENVRLHADLESALGTLRASRSHPANPAHTKVDSAT